MTEKEFRVLAEARATYGSKNQINVAIEELCELACKLSKFGRYDDVDKAVAELRSEVLDEVADVTVVLQHVVAVFNLLPKEIQQVQTRKIARLQNWLAHSDHLEISTKERGLPPTPDEYPKGTETGRWPCKHPNPRK